MTDSAIGFPINPVAPRTAKVTLSDDISFAYPTAAGFPPDLESTRMWDASLEKSKQPSFGIDLQHSKHLVAGA
jgi:hypothetical protein